MEAPTVHAAPEPARVRATPFFRSLAATPGGIKVRFASAESNQVKSSRSRGRDSLFTLLQAALKTVSVASAPPCRPPLLPYFLRISDNCVSREEAAQRGSNICFPFQTTTLHNCSRMISHAALAFGRFSWVNFQRWIRGTMNEIIYLYNIWFNFQEV